MEYASEIQEIFDAEDVQEVLTAKPMALQVMAMALPEVVYRVMNRRFGMDGKAPMSIEDVASRYGLPVGMVQHILHAGVHSMGEMAKVIEEQE